MNYNVFQIGCGGTGGYLVLPLSKFIHHLPPHVHTNYILLDGDVVEEKNTARQNFETKDIGEYKASVLGERYDVEYIPDFVNKDNINDISIRRLGWVNVYLLCVDSVKARLEIRKELFKLKTPCIIIDGGNSAKSGQVYVEEHNINTCKTDCPNLNTVFKDLVDMDDTPTCSVLGDQTIQANYMVAMYMYNIVTELITTGNINTTTVEFTRYTLNTNTNIGNALAQGTL